MRTPQSIWSLVLGWLLTMCCAMSLVGCNRGPAMAQVSGTVLYKDGSVPQGGVRKVRFEPTKDSPAEIRKGAAGIIRDNGTFDMYTMKPGDGVYLGKYAVTFAVWKGPMDPVSLILVKYTNAVMSPYQVTVDGNVDNLKFEIEPLPAGGGASGRTDNQSGTRP
jgi:hypothetical protein